MLRSEDVERARWNPAMPRVDNFALYTFRQGGLPGTARKAPPTRRVDYGVHYLMACGHRSLPNRAVCEQGCLRAPAYGAAFRGTAAKPRGVS